MAIRKIIKRATDSLFVNTEFDGTEAARMPVGTTAQRASAQAGDVRHNSTLGILEQYTADGWQGIAASPTVTGVSPNNIDESDDPQTLVITGSAFDSGATALLVGSGGNITPTTSTRNSSSQITIVYSGGDVITSDTGPYAIKVANSTGLSGTLDAAVTYDDAPNWSTSAGSLGTVFEDSAMSTTTVAATDPEGGSVTYSVTSGALPTGTSLGSSNGQITGTPNVSDTYNSSGVTHNFTVTANDGTGNTTPRAFSILRKWHDGASSATAAGSPYQIATAVGSTPSNGVYWFKNSGYNSGNAFQAYADWSISNYSTNGIMILTQQQVTGMVINNFTDLGTASTSASGTKGHNNTFRTPTATILSTWSGDSANRGIVGQFRQGTGTSLGSASYSLWIEISKSPAVFKTMFDNTPGSAEFTGNISARSVGGTGTFWWSRTNGEYPNHLQMGNSSSAMGTWNQSMYIEYRRAGADANHSFHIAPDGAGGYANHSSTGVNSYNGGSQSRTGWFGFSPNNML